MHGIIDNRWNQKQPYDLTTSHSASPSDHARFHFYAQNHSSARSVTCRSDPYSLQVPGTMPEASIIPIPLKQGLDQGLYQVLGAPLTHKETGHSWRTLSTSDATYEDGTGRSSCIRTRLDLCALTPTMFS